MDVSGTLPSATQLEGARLDFRNAAWSTPVCEVECGAIFGGVRLIVPSSVEVRNETVAIFGGTTVDETPPPRPGAPVLIVKGVALFGGIHIVRRD